MKIDELWRIRVREAADLVLAPLITDGGVFHYDEIDYASRRLSVSYRLAVCDMCAISHEDLAAILDEGLRRAVGSAVAVEMTALPSAP
jgi:hypothetical protein